MRKGICPSLLVILAGLIFCVVNMLRPGWVVCAGGGCEIYANMEFLGVSFYFWGTVLFILLLLARGGPYFQTVSALALAADIPFLIWQTAFVPCSSCLTVAVLLTLNACLARAPARAGLLRPGVERGLTARRCLIAVAVFLVGLGATTILKENIDAWDINGAHPGASRLYFSPSCEPCREHIGILAATAKIETIALIPIAREKEDIVHIAALHQAYADGGPAAFVAALLRNPAEFPGTGASLLLRVRLMWNQATLGRAGGVSLPWMTGYPGSRHATRASTSTSGQQDQQTSTGCDVSPGRCGSPTQEWSW